MVDRKSRDAMLSAFDDYLSGAIKTFDFQERLDALRTSDRTVREIASLAWFHYDDLIDHAVKLTRQEWNYFQRLRLILQSEAEVVREGSWTWTTFHGFVLVALAILAMTWWMAGMGWQFWAMDVALGIVFVRWMAVQRMQEAAPAMIPQAEMFPFDAFSTMRAVYESAAVFRKMPYPRTMDLRPLRSEMRLRLNVIPWLVYWPMLAVVMGLVRGTYSKKIRVVLPQASLSS